MTTMREESVKCAVCGKSSRHEFLMSTNAFGSRDLDFRPPEMQRSTMRLWVQECPYCGYVAGDISDQCRVDREWLASEQYVRCNGHAFRSPLARRFYKHYMLCFKSHRKEEAFYAMLHAAWSCDDAGDDVMAKGCRKTAAALAESLLAGGEAEDKEHMTLIRADLLRRSGQFDRLLSEYAECRLSDEMGNRVIAFQLDKAREEDVDRYRMFDVVDPLAALLDE